MNILLIQTDQQRRDGLGVYGNAVVRTPAIDGLARDGVVFDHCYTPIPLCAPARASLLTGKRPLHHGILFNIESGSVAGRDFRGTHATLAELLAGSGYRSTLCGKWHVGTTLTPAQCGFDGVFYPGYGYPDQHPHYQAHLKKLGAAFSLREPVYSRRPDGTQKILMAAIQEGPEEASEPYYLVDQAIEAIHECAAARQLFFIRVDFWGPHAPYIIPERFARMYDPRQIPPWPNFGDPMTGKPEIQRAYKRYWGIEDFTWQEWSSFVAMCYGYTSLIDEQVGRLRAALTQAGVAGQTAIFYVSDHGGMLGAHGLADKGPYLYDEICRVPLIACVPGQAGGRRSDATVYNMDLMPTMLELAGCPAPDGLDAASLMPILRGERDRVRDDDTAHVEFHGHQVPYAQRLIRTRTAKYIFNAPETDELYDLHADPHELRNAIADAVYADLLNEMREKMRQWMVQMDDQILKFFQGERLARSLHHH